MPKKSSVVCTLHFNKNDIKLTARKISHRRKNRLLDPVTLDDRLSQADSSLANSSLKRLLFEETFLDVSSDSPTKRTRLTSSSISSTTLNSNENDLKIFEERSCQGATNDECNIQELKEENATLWQEIKILEEYDKKKMEDLNELREENAALRQEIKILGEYDNKKKEELNELREENAGLRQEIKIYSEKEKNKTNDLNRLREENAAHQQANRVLEEEKMKILEKLKQIRKEKSASDDRFKQKKKKILRKENEICVPVPLTSIQSSDCSGDGGEDGNNTKRETNGFPQCAYYEDHADQITLPKVGCASGILKNALAEIQLKISEGHLAEATLSLDGMAIKKEIHWDSKVKKYFGFDEFPSVQTAGSDKKNGSVATEALVFYLVSIDGRWETPVAYYFTNHVDSKRLAKLTTEILVECANFGVKVTSIVFDGLPTNIQMTTHLGANLKLPEVTTTTKRRQKTRVTTKNDLTKPFSPYFKHPSTNEPVYVMLDACHLLKLARGLLAMPQGFAGSEATEEYCRRFNKLFDILNSWNINAKGDKEPLNKTNLEEKKKDLKDLTKFLRQLKLPNGRLVSVSKRKTCVVGFLATIKSTIMLSSEFLNKSDEPLDYIATRHMQQDPLEHFFGMIRLRWDDNSLSVDGEIMLDMEIFGSDNDFNNYLLQDQFNDHCLAYIAGYPITKVEKVVKGPVRRSALFSNPDDLLDLSLANVAELRGKRAITIPSQSVFIFIQTAENFFHSFIVQKLDTISNESNLLEKVGQEILKVAAVADNVTGSGGSGASVARRVNRYQYIDKQKQNSQHGERIQDRAWDSEQDEICNSSDSLGYSKFKGQHNARNRSGNNDA
uniref:THAP-type domain-containing protein n=1 Tax=Daphnia galeata TaxID=27404 RepID=A0A8J2RW41_9CRUS|nr:unnamed protein product [Daphnia galeata]